MASISLPGITCWGKPLSQRVCPFPVYPRPFTRFCPRGPSTPLRRPQQLTRVYTSPMMGEGNSLSWLPDLAPSEQGFVG
jgi:hypothetical protein